jgi:glycosyltransferase involved in cell wall biosynthesis
MKSILFIHQSAELYGSDKTILMFISHLDKTKYFPVVVLPFDGPLRHEFEKNGIKVVLAPVLKLYRKMFSPKNLVAFVREYSSGLKTLETLHKQYNFELVYSHTLAALIGIFFARKFKIRHLWHVQEIIAKPKPVNYIFKKMLAWKVNDKAVYDSFETMKFWISGNPGLAAKSVAIWNGLDLNNIPDYPAEQLIQLRTSAFHAAADELVIGLVGRINSWKGQLLLLEAFSLLAAKHPKIRLVFLGSPPPNQDFFLEALAAEIARLKLGERVVVIPFQQEIWKFWKALDIAVVPSTEPEPFGMVAIEAMISQKPVVAANHGGLTEIVVNGETGLLFEPGNATALAAAIEKLIADPVLRNAFGKKGKERATDHFSLENHVAQFEAVFEEIITT